MENKELIQTGLQNVKRGLDRTLDTLTPAELKWQPRSDANSIALILFHMIRAEDSSIQSMIQGKPQLWESDKWYQKLNKASTDSGSHYTAEQVAGFVIDFKESMAYGEAVRKQTLGYFEKIKPEDFDKKLNLPPMPPPPAGAPPAPPRPAFNFTVGTMLLMLVTHLSQHAGEISYLRGLQRGMNK